MHYIGKEQHHGYENRLTPDIYPADFGWTPNWDKPEERQEWYHNMSSVLQAGIAVRTNQLDYDEEVVFKSTQWLYDYVRSPADERRPFFLTVSMTHPHDPYAISKKYWDRYEDVEIPVPKVDAFNQEDQDSHSKRIMKAVDLWDNPLPTEAILRARRAYFGACSYVDDQVGKLLETLDECGLAEDTIVVFTSDHGDMLGERGLWYKMSFFENSARVPMVVHHPNSFAPRRVNQNVSTLDLLPSFVDMARGPAISLPGLGSAAISSDGSEAPSLDSRSGSIASASTSSGFGPYDLIDAIDGKSFYPALHGLSIPSEVIGEYMGEGTISPLIMIKRNSLKYVFSLVDPPQLYDLSSDPLELKNLCLSKDQEHVVLATSFHAEVSQRWNLQALHAQVLRSQRQRQLCWAALTKGKFESWDYEPKEVDGGRYIRSNIPLDELELRARYPVVDAMGRVKTVKTPQISTLQGVPVVGTTAIGNKVMGLRQNPTKKAPVVTVVAFGDEALV
jgi:arylsulfatase A-like enzyme